jgi:flagellar motor component MotA
MSRQLPPHPSIEQLKKQAKDLRKAHQSANAEVMAQIKEHLPRFSDASDEELRSAEISLQDCQHIIAREYGFESWNWLRVVVEVDFELLARLSDREAQTLMREVDQKDLVMALKSGVDDEGNSHDPSEALRDKFLGNMSDRVRGFITEEMEFLGPTPWSEGEEIRRRILKQVVQLAGQGQISWPNGGGKKQGNSGFSIDQYTPQLLELIGRSLEEMSIDENAELWRELAEQARRLGILSLEPLILEFGSPFVREAVQLAVDGTEPNLIEDILETRIEHAILPRLKTRGHMVIEGLVAIRAGDNPRIIHHKQSTFYQTEPSDPEIGSWEASAAELTARLRKKSFVQLEPAAINALFTDTGNLARREGLETLRPLIEAADYPLLQCGLEMVCDKATIGQVIEMLEKMLDEELTQTERRQRMVVAGILALQAGQKPEEVEQKARAAG